MITVKMSDDITKYENKVWGPFTSRQIKCIAIGMLYSLPITALISGDMETKFSVFLMLIIPAIACGYVKLDGIYFEQIVLNLLYMYVLTPPKRKMIHDSEFSSEYEKTIKRQEQIKLSKMSSEEQKKYHATHGKNKKITYSNRKEFKVYR